MFTQIVDNHQANSIEKTMYKLFTAAILLTLLNACAQPPKPLRGEFDDISPTKFVKNPLENSHIRWTGFVVDVENHEKHSCLNIAGKIPDAYAKPSRQKRQGTGRFLACKPQFLDPQLFNNKPVTVVGYAKKVIQRTIGDHNLSQPLVDAQVIYVW